MNTYKVSSGFVFRKFLSQTVGYCILAISLVIIEATQIFVFQVVSRCIHYLFHVLHVYTRYKLLRAHIEYQKVQNNPTIKITLTLAS